MGTGTPNSPETPNKDTALQEHLLVALQQHNPVFASLEPPQQQQLVQDIIAIAADHTPSLLAVAQPPHHSPTQPTAPQEPPVLLEQNRQDSEQRLQTIIEKNADPIIVCIAGNVCFINPAAEMMFGRSAQELLGYDLGIPLVAADKTEVDILDTQGEHHIAEMRVVEITWGGETALLATFRDITRRKELEDQLEQKVHERTSMLQHATERLIIELARREKAEQTIQGRDAIFEAIEYTAQTSLKTTSIKQNIPAILNQLGTATGVNRITLFTVEPLQKLQRMHTWTSSATLLSTLPEDLPTYHTDVIDPTTRTFSRWFERLQKGLSIYGNVQALPLNERDILQQQHIQSLAIIPIFVNDTWWGFLEFDHCYSEHAWLLAEAEALKAIANIIGTAMQREQIQQALLKSEERFRTVADFTYDWEYWVSPEGELLYNSPSCERITGYSPQEFQARTSLLYDIIHPEDRALMPNANKIIQSDKSRDIRIITAQGKERWINRIEQPVYANDGVWLGQRISNRDITERIYAEQALRESEATYRAMFEKNTAVKILVDPDTAMIVDANSAACQFYGYTQETIRDQSLSAIVDLSSNQLQDMIYAAQEEQRTYFTTRHRHASGTTREVEIYTAPIEIHGKTLIYSIIHDITDRIQAKLDLQHKEEHFREIVEETGDLIIQTDPKGIIIYINQATLKYLGHPPETYISRSLFDYIHPDDRKRTQVAFDMWVQRRATSATFENRMLHSNGTVYHLSWSICLHHATDGTPRTINAIAHNITERKQIEHALRESESRYRAISDLITDFAYAIRLEADNTPTLEWVTEAFTRTTGYTLHEIHQAGGWDTIIHPEDQPVIRQRRKWMIAGQASDITEFRIVTKPGDVRWLRNHCRPIWDSAQGRVARIYGAGQDITARVQAEQALRESEKRYRQLVELFPDMIIVHSEGKLMFINEEGAKRFGVESAEEIIGRPIMPHVAPAYREIVANRVAALQSGEQTRTAFIEEQFIRYDGTPMHVEVASSTLVYAGKPAILVVARDITERKRVEQALRESEQKFRCFFEQSRDGLMLIDRQGIILDWNKGAERIWAIPRGEAIQRPVWDVLFQAAPEDHKTPLVYEQTKTTMLHMLQSGRTPSLNQWVWREVQHQDGSRLHIHSLVFPITIDDTLLLGNITRDITEQKQAEEELKQAWQAAEIASRARSEFLANMSHEIRTPLNAIIGMTTLLFNTPLTPEQRDFTDTIRTSSDALLAQINDILDFSKIEAGKLKLEHQPFNLCTCIEETFDLVSDRAAEKRLDLAYMVEPPSLCSLIGDPTRVRQIIANLLSNGVKFTEHGEVTLLVQADDTIHTDEEQIDKSQDTARPQHTMLHMYIADTGVGIPKEALDKLFQSFTQIDTSTTRKYSGTGLGLIISKRLAELMGGTIEIASEPDQGTTLHVSLALERLPDIHDQSSPELANKHLLVIQQDTTTHRYLTRWLATWGCQITTITSSAAAYDVLQQPAVYDGILLDSNLPNTEGDHLTQAVCAAYPNTPFILLIFPGSQDGKELTDTLILMHKPLKPTYLHQTLRSIFTHTPIPSRSRMHEHYINPQMAHHYPLTMLLAEDNALNQKIALHLLKRMGYLADIAANGIEVLNALRRQTYDVILMDVQMPEMDGIQATRHIRMHHPEDRQPWIIAMTAYALVGDRERCLAAGMNDYVSKPVHIEELIEALYRVSSTAKPVLPTELVAESVQATMREIMQDESPEGQSLPLPEGQLERQEINTMQPFNNTGTPSTNTIDPQAYNLFRQMIGEEDTEAIIDMLDLFMDDVPEKLAKMEQALEQADHAKLSQIAHALKSSSAQIGALSLSEHCKQLEAATKSTTQAELQQLVSSLKAEYQRVERALQQLCAAEKNDNGE